MLWGFIVDDEKLDLSEIKKIKPSIEITRPEVITNKTNGNTSPGIIGHVREVWPEGEAGAIASLLAAATSNGLDREHLMSLLDDYDADAQAMATEAGHDTPSTLDTHEASLADVSTQNGSIIELAYSVESKVADIRQAVEHFEKHTTDRVARANFYDAMCNAVHLAHRYHLLELKRYEERILKGDAKNFNHQSAAPPVQRQQAVERVLALKAAEGISRDEACRRLAPEFGGKWRTLKDWCVKSKKS